SHRAEPWIARAELRALQHARDALARERDRDPDDDLIETQPDAEHDHERAGDHPADRPGAKAEPRGVAVVGADEADVRAHEHHPLEPEVEHAGALRDRLADRREHQWDARDDATGDPRGEAGLVAEAAHATSRVSRDA